LHTKNHESLPRWQQPFPQYQNGLCNRNYRVNNPPFLLQKQRIRVHHKSFIFNCLVSVITLIHSLYAKNFYKVYDSKTFLNSQFCLGSWPALTSRIGKFFADQSICEIATCQCARYVIPVSRRLQRKLLADVVSYKHLTAWLCCKSVRLIRRPVGESRF